MRIPYYFNQPTHHNITVSRSFPTSLSMDAPSPRRRNGCKVDLRHTILLTLLGDEMDKQPSRQRIHHLRVPVLPAENIAIKKNAANCGLSVSTYLRELGLHHKPKTILDYDAALELVKVNADLGRLGGLLKMWLTNNDGWQASAKEQSLSTIHALLQAIQTTQDLLWETASKVH